MTHSIKRRDFIKNASVPGASVAIADPASVKTFLSGNDVDELKNDYFTVSFDRKIRRLRMPTR